MSIIQCLFVFTLVLGVINAVPVDPVVEVVATPAAAAAVDAPPPAIANSVATAATPGPENVPAPVQQGPANPAVLGTGTSLYSQNLAPGQGVAKVTHRKGPDGSSVVETVYTGALSQADLAHITGQMFRNINMNMNFPTYGYGYGYPQQSYYNGFPTYRHY